MSRVPWLRWLEPDFFFRKLFNMLFNFLLYCIQPLFQHSLPVRVRFVLPEDEPRPCDLREVCESLFICLASQRGYALRQILEFDCIIQYVCHFERTLFSRASVALIGPNIINGEGEELVELPEQIIFFIRCDDAFFGICNERVDSACTVLGEHGEHDGVRHALCEVLLHVGDALVFVREAEDLLQERFALVAERTVDFRAQGRIELIACAQQAEEALVRAYAFAQGGESRFVVTAHFACEPLCEDRIHVAERLYFAKVAREARGPLEEAED